MSKGRTQWTKPQDRYLSSLVEGKESINWAEIAREINRKFQDFERSGKQWRDRWNNYCNPSIAWSMKITQQEEARIFSLYKEHGNKWVEISKQLPGRTENWVKNLYYATLRRFARNINKFKSVHPEIKSIETLVVNEKMLSDLFLTNDVKFEDFQSIDSEEFKILSKKVAQWRKRLDSNMIEYLFGWQQKQTKHKSKSKRSVELNSHTTQVLDSIKRVFDSLIPTNKYKYAPIKILKEENKDDETLEKVRTRRWSTIKKDIHIEEEK